MPSLFRLHIPFRLAPQVIRVRGVLEFRPNIVFSLLRTDGNELAVAPEKQTRFLSQVVVVSYACIFGRSIWENHVHVCGQSGHAHRGHADLRSAVYE
jgi:hypothetical protein